MSEEPEAESLGELHDKLLCIAAWADKRPDTLQPWVGKACRNAAASLAQQDAMREGVRRIADERERQVDVEGWSPEDDMRHASGEMALAAATYAAYMPDIPASALLARPLWPWHADWWKPKTREIGDQTGAEYVEARIRDLERAGALIAAEIDRLLRVRQALSQTGEA